MNVIDLAGHRFGRLTVVGRVQNDHSGRSIWRCSCICGATKDIKSSDLRRGRVRSCGCLLRDTNKAIKSIHGRVPKGMISPEFRAWSAMKERCYQPKHVSYPRYGGRGISVCERWLSGDGDRTGFECFLEDMGRRPSSEHSLDRFPDNHGNYEPSNCRWATPREQGRNKANNRAVVVDGEKILLLTACERYGVNVDMVAMRLKRGWSPERALTTPKQPSGRKPGGAR